MTTPSRSGSAFSKPLTGCNGKVSESAPSRGKPTSRTSRFPCDSISTQVPPISLVPRWMRTFIRPKSVSRPHVPSRTIQHTAAKRKLLAFQRLDSCLRKDLFKRSEGFIVFGLLEDRADDQLPDP